MYDSTTYTQDLTLDIKVGNGNMRTALVEDQGNLVYLAEVALRNDISKKMKKEPNFVETVGADKTINEKQACLITIEALKFTD